MPTVDEILAGSPLAGLRRVSRGGGDREVTVVRLAERFAELDDAPAGSFVVLSRAASAEVTDYRLDMALRWAAIHRVAAVAAFAAEAVAARGDRAGHRRARRHRAGSRSPRTPTWPRWSGRSSGRSAAAPSAPWAARSKGSRRCGGPSGRRAGPEELGQAAGRALGTKVEFVATPAGGRG